MKTRLQDLSFATVIAGVVAVAVFAMGGAASQMTAAAAIGFIAAMWYRTGDVVQRTIAWPVVIIACADYAFPKAFANPNTLDALAYLPAAALTISVLAVAAAVVRSVMYRGAPTQAVN